MEIRDPKRVWKQSRPRSGVVCFVLVLALAPWMTAPALAFEIRLLDHALVETAEVRLGDVAAIDGASAELEAWLFAVRVDRAPRVGQRVAISRTRIAAIAGQARPPVPLSWSGSDSVEVLATGRPWPAAALTDPAASALQAWLGRRADTFHVAPLAAEGREGELLWLPRGTVTLAAAVPTGSVVAPRMRVFADVLVDGAHYVSVPVWFRVEATSMAWAAAIPIERSARVDERALERRSVDLTRVGGPRLRQLPEVPVRATRRLEPGEVLRQTDVEVAPEVGRGEAVRVRSQVGNVSVERDAIALEDGRLGERVRVLWPADGRRRVARVTAFGAAETEVAR